MYVLLLIRDQSIYIYVYMRMYACYSIYIIRLSWFMSLNYYMDYIAKKIYIDICYIQFLCLIFLV